MNEQPNIKLGPATTNSNISAEELKYQTDWLAYQREMLAQQGA
jgi:hypothetical protein